MTNDKKILFILSHKSWVVSRKSELRILFTGGGTGGHIYPIVAVAEELKTLAAQKGIELNLQYLGAPGPFKNTLESYGIKVSKTLSAKWRRYFDLRNLIDIPKFFFALIHCLWKIFWNMPDVLFSKGGPGALAVVLVARFYRVPVIIHESDSIPGITNKISSRFAQRIAIAFASATSFFKDKNVALVGNPLRRFLLEERVVQRTTRGLITTGKIDQVNAKRILGFKTDKSLILVLGGSQGAMRINEFILLVAPEILKKYQLLHQVGVKNFSEIEKEIKILMPQAGAGENKYKIVPYFENDIKEALIAADLVICRPGSNIFELAALGKPAILIPIPEKVVGLHQVANAYEYAQAGAAIVIEEENLKPNIFMLQLDKIFSEPGKLQTMSENAKKFAKPEAARLVAEEIIKLGGKN